MTNTDQVQLKGPDTDLRFLDQGHRRGGLWRLAQYTGW